MSVFAALTNAKLISIAIQEIKDQLTIQPNVLLYFASSSYNAQELAPAMQNAFPGITTFGCTTAGEIVSGKMSKESIAVMAFDNEIIADIDVEIVPNISNENNVAQAFQRFSVHYQKASIDLNPSQYVGIVLCDGLTKAEEKIIDTIGNMTNVTFIGGSAGDDLQFKKTYVFANGCAYTDAALLALIKPKCAFDFIKTQSFHDTGKKLIATKVDEENRIVMGFNHQPAAQAYAEAIGQSTKNIAKYFMKYPLGLMIDNEPYVRSPQQVKGDSIIFYCNVKEGMELSVLEAIDMLAETAAAIKEKEKEFGEIKAIINFHCILRTLQLEEQKLMLEYGKIFTKIPTIGFSTYGEAYIGHINQTATMLILG